MQANTCSPSTKQETPRSSNVIFPPHLPDVGQPCLWRFHLVVFIRLTRVYFYFLHNLRFLPPQAFLIKSYSELLYSTRRKRSQGLLLVSYRPQQSKGYTSLRPSMHSFNFEPRPCLISPSVSGIVFIGSPMPCEDRGPDTEHVKYP